LADGRQEPAREADEGSLASDGRKARADAPSTWGTRLAAEAWAAQLDRRCGDAGVGLKLGVLDGLAIGGVDLDTCRDRETGK
jgi:hypothetical protein